MMEIADKEPQSPMELAEQKDNIWRIARSTLTREQYDALWLFYVEDLPANQIAKIMSKSWVSVKTMLHRARKRLKPLIQADRGVEIGGRP